jgi:acetyl/propionyl-CoA carboxylase alpha subunit
MESFMKRVTLVSGDQTFPFDVGEKDGRTQIHLDEKAVDIDVGKQVGGGLSVLMNGRSYEVQVVLEDREITVELDGERFKFEIDDAGPGAKGGRRGGPGGMVEVKAPMPGKVVKLLVPPGDTVESGQGILLFEAMKMQNEVRSPLAGVLESLSVEEGQAVEAREPLFKIKGT